MLDSLLQRSARIAVVSTAALATVVLAALPGYSQDLGTFGSGPFRTTSDGFDSYDFDSHDFDRSLQAFQSLGPDVICGNDVGRSRYSTRRRFYTNRGYYRTHPLTNNPLIPNRLDSQQIDSRPIGQTLTNNPLVPNRLNSQPASSSLAQVSRSASRTANCQTIRNSSITTINQPLSNQSVNITINSRPQAVGNVANSRSGGDDKLPLSAIANLPDGNYRLTSAANLRNDVSTAELANGGGRLFTFNKSGSTITGNLNDFDGGFSACVTGSVEGNIVTGQAFTNDLGADVLGRNYLDLGLALELGDQVGGDRYNSSVLNLSGFSRINAGQISPPTRC